MENKKLLTLCVIIRDGRVLLGMKKRGFGAGLWNGFGGKVEAGESVEEAARREVREEIGVELAGIEKRGMLEFKFGENPQISEVHIFHAGEFLGTPVETEEMRPQWFAFRDIPYETMWPDDQYWLPLLLRGKRFRGRVEFDAQNAIIHSDIRETEIVN